MLCPAHVSAHEPIFVLTMAPRIRNKKKSKQITLPTQIGTPVPTQHRRLPHHQNDDGTMNFALNMDTRQVDNNPPRFEIIGSDDKSGDHTTSSGELESEELPPVAEATPTMS